MFSERTLTEIKERVSIVDLVGEYVQLKKAGSGFTGLCPFHKEKTPSFHVHPMKQIFHCFGCNKGGNVFMFLVELDGLKFPEAVERLAKRCGVTLEYLPSERYRRHRPAPVKNADRLIAANELTARFFHHLLVERPEYRFALDYVKGRGLTLATLQKFQIGVSPRGWSTLIDVLMKRGFTFAEMVAAGLVIPREGTAPKENQHPGYDRFRERLMFPIKDFEGNVVGFGARLLKDEPRKDGTPQPKYINSPESPLFAKRRILYGLHENQRGVRKRGEAVIVEGYMDVVGLHQAGVDNALATMGTALTEEHCFQIKNLTRRVVTVFDPDAAGTDASRRSMQVLLTAGIFAKDLTLPDGQDPDDFVLAKGAEIFYELCEKAPLQRTKLLKEIAAQGPMSEEKAGKYLSELTPILAASRSLPPGERAQLWDDVSLLFKMTPAGLKALVENAAPKVRPSPLTAPPGKPAPGTAPSGKPAPKVGPTDRLSRDILTEALRHPSAFLALRKDGWIEALPEGKIRDWLVRLSEATTAEALEKTLEHLVHHEPDPVLVSLASEGLMRQEDDAPGPVPAGEMLGALVAQAFLRKKKQEIHSLSTQLQLSQRLGDEGETLRLLKRIEELKRTS